MSLLQSAEGSSRNDSIAIGLALAAGVVGAAQIGKMPVSLTALQSQLGLSLVEVGWIATAINGTIAFFGLVSGLASARMGTRAALLWGLLLIAVGSLAGAISPSGAFLLGSRFLEGAGFVLVIVSAPSIITAASAPHRRVFWLSAWGCYMPVGVSAMLVLTPLLIEAGGWRAAWWVNGVLLLGVLGLAWQQRDHLPQRPGPAPPALGSQLLRAIRLRGAWLMGTAFAAHSAQWFMIVTWLPYFAVEDMGLTLRQAGWLTAFATFCNVGGCLSATPVVRAGVPRWLILVGVQLMLGVTGLILFSTGLNAELRLVLAVIVCGASGILPATVFGWIPSSVRSSTDVALANGVVVQCINMGVFVGPPAIAAVVAHFGGWDSGRWLFPVIAAVGLGVSLQLRRFEQRGFVSQIPSEA